MPCEDDFPPASPPPELGLHAHFKGGFYSLLMFATDSTNERVGTPVAVYVSLTTGRVHVRALAEFTELVMWPDGQQRPRFTPVHRLGQAAHRG